MSKLGDMRPIAISDNRPHSSAAESVFPSQRLLGDPSQRIPGSDLPDLSGNQFCAPLPFAARHTIGPRVRAVTAPLGQTIRVGTRSVLISPQRIRTPLPGPIAIVIRRRAGKEMARSDAWGIIAMVQDARLVRGERAVGQDVGDGVSATATAVQLKLSVSVGVRARGPEPARPEFRTVGGDRSALIDFRPESVGNNGTLSRHRSSSLRCRTPGSSRYAGVTSCPQFYHTDSRGRP